MNEIVDKLVHTLLFEGYALYPYRPSVKNRQRWTFGGLYPPAWSDAQEGSDACSMRVECLVSAPTQDATIGISVRFIHLTDRVVAKLPEEGTDAEYQPVDVLEVAGKRYEPWQEATERSVHLGDFHLKDLLGSPQMRTFGFPSSRETEELRRADGQLAGVLIRRQHAIHGDAELSPTAVEEGLVKISLTVRNRTALAQRELMTRDSALMGSFLSTHVILNVREGAGEFVSLTDPPQEWRSHAAACSNVGCWPVLVGTSPARDTLLASPIILSDYPQLAPESPGDLFDATEIDEILTLRVMTLTEDEKRAAAAIDPRVGDLLARTESMPSGQLASLHGAMRGLPPAESQVDVEPRDTRRQSVVLADNVTLHLGDHVRLRPLGRADVFDIALDGMAATIVAIEQDFDNRTHVVVTIDDDPGKDLGAKGQPGHRFYFGVDEIEPFLTDPATTESRT